MKLFSKVRRHRRFVGAALFVLNIFNQSLISKAVAAPIGPTQSEAIPSVGAKNNVDLFSGDFKYSIPILELDGYPLHLCYSSNVNANDEASWVGLGWSLNPGAVNRIMRGVPDDFNGDKVVKEFNIKPNWTAGLNVGAQVQIANFEPTKFISAGLGMGAGVFYNSYNGLGTELSFGPNINIGKSVSNLFTFGLNYGAQVNSNSQKGVTTSAKSSLSVSIHNSSSSSLSFGTSTSSTFNLRHIT